MDDSSCIKQNLDRVMERVHKAAKRSGRDVEEITVVGVTKTHPASVVMAGLKAGILDIGENRPEEMEMKRHQVEQQLPIGSPKPIWHMIGHIQSRKANSVAASADIIHSLDSIKLARRLERFATEEERFIPALLEVNVSGEESKYGFAAENWQDQKRWQEICQAVREISSMTHIRLQGLMTMAPWVADTDVIRMAFRSARQMMEKLAAEFPNGDWRHLSMGMTDDFEIAIEEGATLIRIGRAIFGTRK